MALLAAGLMLAGSVPAAAQVFSWPGLKLSRHDTDLLRASVDRLNRSPDVGVGSTNDWSDPKTRARGTNTVTRIFRDGGESCHAIRHEITLGRKTARTYDLNWCLTPEGWRVRS